MKCQLCRIQRASKKVNSNMTFGHRLISEVEFNLCEKCYKLLMSPKVNKQQV
jgi:hypothetical protein